MIFTFLLVAALHHIVYDLALFQVIGWHVALRIVEKFFYSGDVIKG